MYFKVVKIVHIPGGKGDKADIRNVVELRKAIGDGSVGQHQRVEAVVHFSQGSHMILVGVVDNIWDTVRTKGTGFQPAEMAVMAAMGTIMARDAMLDIRLVITPVAVPKISRATSLLGLSPNRETMASPSTWPAPLAFSAEDITRMPAIIQTTSLVISLTMVGTGTLLV